MRFEFIANQATHYPVVILCKVMHVSRSGYYDYLKRAQRQPSPGEVDTVRLIAEIKAIHEESKSAMAVLVFTQNYEDAALPAH